MRTKNDIIKSIGPMPRQADWEVAYNEGADSLYWTAVPPPRNDNFVGLAPGMYFYMDQAGNVTGMMIEWFQSDFLPENQDAAGLMDLLTEKDSVFWWSIPRNKKAEAQKFLAALLEGVKKSVAEEMQADTKGVELLPRADYRT